MPKKKKGVRVKKVTAPRKKRRIEKSALASGADSAGGGLAKVPPRTRRVRRTPDGRAPGPQEAPLRHKRRGGLVINR